MAPADRLPQPLDLDLQPFAGRYIALLEGRIIAVADSAEAVRIRAAVARPQRPASILWVASSAGGEAAAESSGRVDAEKP